MIAVVIIIFGMEKVIVVTTDYYCYYFYRKVRPSSAIITFMIIKACVDFRNSLHLIVYTMITSIYYY